MLPNVLVEVPVGGMATSPEKVMTCILSLPPVVIPCMTSAHVDRLFTLQLIGTLTVTVAVPLFPVSTVEVALTVNVVDVSFAATFNWPL